MHYNRHWFWETGNGEIGNQEYTKWTSPAGQFPKPPAKVGPQAVISLWAIVGWTSQIATTKIRARPPNMHLTVFDFDGVLLVFEIVGLVGRKGVDGQARPQKVDNEFITDEGIIRLGQVSSQRKRQRRRSEGRGRAAAVGIRSVTSSRGIRSGQK